MKLLEAKSICQSEARRFVQKLRLGDQETVVQVPNATT